MLSHKGIPISIQIYQGTGFLYSMRTGRSGFWGPHLVDYLGIPLNEEGQNRGISYDATTISMPERQCIFFVPHYVLRGPFGFAFWYDTDPRTGEITAWHHGAGLDMGEMTIWMDGREPPSELAPRNVGGTAYGEWIGNTLKAEFPYMQEGLMSRNGAPSSDQASLTLYFTVNENLLTVVGGNQRPCLSGRAVCIKSRFST